MKQLHSGIGYVAVLGVALGLLAPSVERRAETEMTTKIDVSRYVKGMEGVLHSRQDPVSCETTITILRRWQFDEMLDDASRAKAGTLVREFESARRSQTTLERRDSGEPRLDSPSPLEQSL
jgi:hypothetical protein